VGAGWMGGAIGGGRGGDERGEFGRREKERERERGPSLPPSLPPSSPSLVSYTLISPPALCHCPPQSRIHLPPTSTFKHLQRHEGVAVEALPQPLPRPRLPPPTNQTASVYGREGVGESGKEGGGEGARNERMDGGREEGTEGRAPTAEMSSRRNGGGCGGGPRALGALKWGRHARRTLSSAEVLTRPEVSRRGAVWRSVRPGYVGECGDLNGTCAARESRVLMQFVFAAPCN
jgi:hypothetical protein